MGSRAISNGRHEPIAELVIQWNFGTGLLALAPVSDPATGGKGQSPCQWMLFLAFGFAIPGIATKPTLMLRE